MSELSGNGTPGPRDPAPPSDSSPDAAARPRKRGTRQEIASGALWSVATWIVSTLAGPVLVVALVRRMARVEFGALATASSAIGLVMATVLIGLGPALARYGAVARADRGDAGLWRVLTDAARLIALATGAAVLAGGGLLLVAFWVPNLHSSRPALIAFLPTLALAPAVGAAGGFLRAAYRPRWISLAGVVGALASAVVIVAGLIVTRPAAWFVAGARTGGALLSGALLGWGVLHWHRSALGHEARPHDGEPAAAATDLRSPRVTRGSIVRFGMAIQLGTLFGTAVNELGVFLLGAERGAHSAAIFAPAAGVAATVLAVPALIGGFFLPGIAPAASRGDHAEVGRLFYWASRWNLALTAPALGVLVVCPADVLKFLFGQGLVPAAGALRILGIGCVIQVVFGFNGLTLGGYGLSGLLAKLNIACVIVASLCCVLFIPPFDLTGAAVAASAGLFFANVLYSTILRTRFGIAPTNRAMLSTVALFACATGLSFWISQFAERGLVRCLLVAAVTGSVTLLAAFGSGGRSDRARMLELGRERWRRQGRQLNEPEGPEVAPTP
ncbi:MAG: lipopolysaccharide biosynthesis protein [Acidimicrobiales bacterium]